MGCASGRAADRLPVIGPWPVHRRAGTIVTGREIEMAARAPVEGAGDRDSRPDDAGSFAGVSRWLDREVWMA